jgi:hypothetical protein
MLLKKAEILGAQSEFAKAFTALDQYDLHAVDEEREKASALRNELLFKQKSTLEDVKDQLKKATEEGNYVKVHDLAMRGLRASDNDSDLVYQAATSSIISREHQQSRALFIRYLAITNTLDGNLEQWTTVRAMLASSIANPTPETGERNWLSGKKLPANVFYCPISLAFQPVFFRRGKILPQQHVHCALAEPLPIHPKLAARIDQPIHHQQFQHLCPGYAFPSFRQLLRPELIQL